MNIEIRAGLRIRHVETGVCYRVIYTDLTAAGRLGYGQTGSGDLFMYVSEETGARFVRSRSYWGWEQNNFEEVGDEKDSVTKGN